nr:hydrocephalus-inducing protein homolog [Nothobranchius furzeri]
MEVERLLLSGVLMEITHSQKSFQLQPSKFKLPEYVLDFGFAIPGKAVNQSVNIINTGSVPVSFYMNGKLLIGTGFTAASERVKNLPCGQTHSFLLTFDPERANLEMGETSVVLPVQVSGGPQVMVRLRAFVIVPRITVFEDTLQFDSVQRGMCQMRTLQLLNLEPIPCCWSITEEAKPFKKVDRFVPLHVRKKILQEQRPPLTVLEMSPCDGVLSPGGKVLVYVTFCPAEGGSYRRRLKVHVKDSSQQLMITAVGQCEEPQLDLCQAVLELGPCLPFYTEAESEIMIRNPCSFPIEFYSLEFDSEYLKEEKILRLMPGYDENNVLLLPPRVPGEGLPTELLDHYKDLSSQLEDDGPNVVDDQTKNDDIRKENVKSKQNNTRMSASDVKPAKTIISELNREANRGRLGELEMTPVSRALARHMGFDLSPEGLMACSRSGIAIIVYGAPLTDSSSVAADLAGYYEAACLSVDAVVTDVIQNGTSPVSLSARQLYHTAAECAQLKAESTRPPEDLYPHLGASPAPVDIQAEQRESSCRPRRSIHQDTDDKRFYECHGEVQLSSLLPGHLLVDILMERFQLNDCDQGVVVDGLKSQYTETSSNTLQVVLKALKNRKYIYVVNVNDTYAARKAREKEQKEAEDALQHERPGGEEQQVWELKEDEREHGTQRKLRELEAKPQEERRQQDGKSRQNEELKKKKNGRRMNSTETSAGAKEQLNLNESAQHQSKKERPLQLLEEEKLSGNAFLKPRVQSEKKMNIMDELQSQFIEYEESQVMVMHFLQHWDRIQGLLLAPLPGAEIPPDSNVATAEHQHKADNKPGDTGSSLQNIPLIVMNVTETGGNFTELLSNGTLPLLDEILDHLGLGPSSPPIPPPATFSAVVFPKQRDRTMVKETCFIFLEPSGQKTDAKQTMKEALSKSNEGAIKENVKDKEKKVKENKMKAQKSKSKGSCILSQVSFPVELTDHDHHQQRLEMKRSQSRTTFRWIVPPNGQVPLKVWFYSETTGEYEQIFNFEIAGTRKPFQLTCRGRCTYPFICSKHTTLFTHCEKVPQGKDELQRAYIIKDGYFEFGPLLCAKPRDRYKECGFPENSVRVVIHNISSLDAEVMFSFQHDLQAATYLLDPPMMILPPGQKQELTIWAYPTKEGQIKDSVVCLVKDNPEPVIINVSCWGVHPKLELERKSLNFGKLLLHRRDSRSTELFNKTSLPVSWRLQGVEEFCEELVVPQVQGIIPPNSSFTLSVEFTPKRPLVFEKVLYLEVSDAEKILGTVQSLTIRVTAEAWDLKLEITPDIQLDFGTVRVFQETKQSVRLVNKGKCDLSVKFMVMQSNPALPKPESIFTITPQKSFQLPIKKPTTVSITCTPDREVSIKSQPILVCQVMEFKFGEKGQTLTFVDFHVSLQAVFSRYQITPAQEADFGPLVCGTKKSQSFNIENKGQLQFQFTISCNGSHPGENSSAKSTCTGPKRKETPVQQKLLTLGEFSVCPCSGSVQPGSSQQVIVDFVADQPGTWNQILVIDISGRNPSDHPDGIPYRLMAEACKPAIDLDTTFIFEEHFLCHSRSQLSSDQFREAEGIYVVDENKFVFNKIQVGRTAQARFRMTNTNNVSCRLKLAIRSVRPQASQNMDIFGLPVTVLKVPKQSHALAFVTFTPKAAQHYSAVFQAMVEGSGSTTSENKRLEFGLEGEGNLPTIRVLRPVLRTSSGAPKMHFGHVWVGRRRTLPLVLLNDGNVTAQVHIYMMDKFGVFTIEDSSGNTSVHSTQPEDSDVRSEHRAILTLNAKEQTSFEVSFCSDKPMCVRASLLLQVKDNKHSNTTVQVTGEAYQEIISLNNILRSPQQTDQEEEPEGNYKVLHFGDCYINMVHQKRFTMTNHSSSQVARFEWPLGEPLINISPQVGHIHAGCSKEVIVSFRSSQPVTLINQPMRCKICLVELQQPTQQMADWDDQQRIVLYESTSSLSASESSEQPVVTKVTKTVPQPACSVVEGSEGELNLCISAVCDFMKFSCNTDSIHFKDTGIFQTRIHQLQMMNVGDVKVEFSWNVYMDPGTNFINRDQKGETSTSRSSSRSSVSLSGRPSSALGSIMSLLMRNPEELPFSVEPAFGTIDPGATQSFHIRFSPVEVAQFQGKLLCSIPNLQDGDQAPCIPVLGRSLLPHCHFDFEDSDYISNNRRRPEFRRPVDPNSRVLEFEAVGLFQTTTRCFNVVNPTSKAYSFRWRCEDTDATRFRCLTSSGSIQPGTSLEMRFKYSANQKDTVESFWSFVVETLSLSVPFLLVGTAREPHVYLSRAHVDFGELTVGCKFQQTVDLVNEEKEPAHFSVLQSSLSSEDQQSCVILKPMDGEVASESRLPLLVFFNPTSKRPVNFKLVLKVKRKSEPLTLTVKANCFSENTSVLVETQDGALREVTPTQRDTLDFGKVGISEQSSFNILVFNPSKFTLEVTFELSGPRDQLRHLKAKHSTATIKAGVQLHTSLSFSPQSVCRLQGVTLTMKVKLGPTFTFVIKGSAEKARQH